MTLIIDGCTLVVEDALLLIGRYIRLKAFNYYGSNIHNITKIYQHTVSLKLKQYCIFF